VVEVARRLRIQRLGRQLRNRSSVRARRNASRSVRSSAVRRSTESLGADNVLDNYSDKAQFLIFVGRVYPSGLPYENDGLQGYVRVGIGF
jgi:hypothetical protein